MARASTNAPRGPVSLAEALERLLPYCENDPHKVAARLDTQQCEGDICLLGNGVAMPPNANPSTLGIKARIPPDGRAFLYVDVRKAFSDDFPGDGAVWDGKRVNLEAHHKFWALDRTSFEAHFPVPVDRGGRPQKFKPKDRENILTEAAMSIYEDGPPEHLTLEALCEQVGLRLGKNSPGSTLLKGILRPFCAKLKASHYNREKVLIEAAMFIAEGGLPKPLTLTLDAFSAKVAFRLGENSPESTKDILRPLYTRLKAKR